MDVTDFDGHGTHCAGVIFGRDVDGMRIGVARGITDVLIGKVVGGEGPTLDGLADAINWAHLEGAHVLSMSLGIDFEAHRQAFIDQGMPGPQATSMALVDYAACIRLFDRLAEHGGGAPLPVCGVPVQANLHGSRPRVWIRNAEERRYRFSAALSFSTFPLCARGTSSSNSLPSARPTTSGAVSAPPPSSNFVI